MAVRRHSGLLSNNVLLRRVQRHANMSTLFHAADSDGGGIAPAAYAPTGGPLVVAQLAAVPQPAAPALPVPAERVETAAPVYTLPPAAQPQAAPVQREPVSQQSAPVPRAPQVAAPVPTQPQVAAQTAPVQRMPEPAAPATGQTPPAVQPTPVQRSVEPAAQPKPAVPTQPPAPTVQRSGGSGLSDDDWSRLKQVMQGHQEKIAREGPPPPPPQPKKKEVPPAVQRKIEAAMQGRRERAQVVYVSEPGKAATPVRPAMSSPVTPPVQRQVDPPTAQPGIEEPAASPAQRQPETAAGQQLSQTTPPTPSRVAAEAAPAGEQPAAPPPVQRQVEVAAGEPAAPVVSRPAATTPQVMPTPIEGGNEQRPAVTAAPVQPPTTVPDAPLQRQAVAAPQPVTPQPTMPVQRAAVEGETAVEQPAPTGAPGQPAASPASPVEMPPVQRAAVETERPAQPATPTAPPAPVQRAAVEGEMPILIAPVTPPQLAAPVVTGEGTADVTTPAPVLPARAAGQSPAAAPIQREAAAEGSQPAPPVLPGSDDDTVTLIQTRPLDPNVAVPPPAGAMVQPWQEEPAAEVEVPSTPDGQPPAAALVQRSVGETAPAAATAVEMAPAVQTPAAESPAPTATAAPRPSEAETGTTWVQRAPAVPDDFDSALTTGEVVEPSGWRPDVAAEASEAAPVAETGPVMAVQRAAEVRPTEGAAETGQPFPTAAPVETTPIQRASWPGETSAWEGEAAVPPATPSAPVGQPQREPDAAPTLARAAETPVIRRQEALGETPTYYESPTWGVAADMGAGDTAVTGEAETVPAQVQRAAEWETMDAPAAEAGEEPVQPMPLQAAWPVEAVGQPQPETPSRPPLVQRRSAEEMASDESVRSILETVTAGQKSDSSIELVLPRRPRPAGLPPVAAKPAAEPPAAPPVQRMPLPEVAAEPVDWAVQPSEDSEFSEGGVSFLGEPPQVSENRQGWSEGAEGGPVQRVVERPAPAPVTPHMVPTEIGDLPSDLWQLLGATPPAPAASPPAGNGGTAVQRQATTAVRPAQPAPASYMAAPVVQRAEAAAPEPAPPTAEAPAATATAGEEGEKKSEVDIDELSRQVMQVLRRRLAVEWERSRGRY